MVLAVLGINYVLHLPYDACDVIVCVITRQTAKTGSTRPINFQ